MNTASPEAVESLAKKLASVAIHKILPEFIPNIDAITVSEPSKDRDYECHWEMFDGKIAIDGIFRHDDGHSKDGGVFTINKLVVHRVHITPYKTYSCWDIPAAYARQQVATYDASRVVVLNR
jgi:uncharacterized protein YodC (DUF2158 family)